ncbi:MAG: methylated-DNA--[protein]-cysteine S-methyltransferase [Candidatus Ventricola sp.]
MAEMSYDSPVGMLVLAADDEGMRSIRLLRAGEAAPRASDMPLLREARAQLQAYFAHELRAFDLPLHAQGTSFERAVWQQLKGIAYGEARTYGQLAAALGRPNAARAVGGACGRNPLLIVVPCHRVVGASGRLTGFAAGLPAKRALLTLEGWAVDGDRLCLR